MSELALIPYINIDGEWSLPDHIMIGLYRQMIQDGTAETFFRYGLPGEDKFVAFCKEEQSFPVLVMRKTGEPLGLWFLKDFGHNYAHTHFVMFKPSWGVDSVSAGRMVFQHYFNCFKQLDIIMGMISSRNTRAIEFVQKIGVTIIGAIPKIMWNGITGEKMDAMFGYIERGTTNEWSI